MSRKHAQRSMSILTASLIFMMLIGLLFSVTLTKRVQQESEASTGHHQATHNRPSVAPQAVSPTNVGVSGTNMGLPNTDYTFTVTAAAGTTPISYTWEATEQATIIHSNRNALNDLQSFRWLSGGVKTVTVTLRNRYGVATATNVIMISEIPLMNVILSGPTTGDIGNSYTFDANSLPIYASQPITYVWQASEQPPITMANGLNSSQSFSWSTPGAKTITLRASNNNSTATANYTININDIAPTSVAITGATNGQLGTTYSFTANVAPISSTQPLTYTWKASEHTSVTRTISALSDTIPLSWSTTGTKTITVMASNRSGTVTTTHMIHIGQVPPAALSIQAPTEGQVESSYEFMATLSPTDTTQPITYTWLSTDLPDLLSTSNSFTDGRALSWDTPGTKMITVTANNESGTVTATHSIAIRGIPAAQLAISGPTSGIVGLTYPFTATVTPPTATQPITYIWHPIGHQPITRTANSVTDTQFLSWDTPGTKMISVTALNDGGEVSATHLISLTLGGVPPITLTLAGAEAEPTYIRKAHLFTATVAPLSTTQPLTYTWVSTDQLSLTHSSNMLTATQPFTWTSLGQKTLTVTVENEFGTVSDTYPLIIEQVPAQKIVLEGPESTYLGQSITLNANVGKSDTSTPLTYTWQATGQETITRTSQALIATRAYTWTIAGPKTITVTAANESGIVTATHAITVVQPLLKLEMSDSADPVLVGEEFTYLLTVTNDAPITATEVVVFNELPLESRLISMTSSAGYCREENGDITCQLGRLTSTQRITMSFLLTPTTNGRLTNRAKLTSAITELEVNANIVAEETVVSKPGLGVTKVTPDETFNDVPSIVYIEGFGFHKAVTVTLMSQISETLTTTLVSRAGQLFTETRNSPPLKVDYQDAVLIIANIPAQLKPGMYDIVVTTDSDEARITNAYQVFDASKLNDLRSSPSWMATNPFPMKVATENSGISLTLQYLGRNKIQNPKVEYRLESITGTLLGQTDVITNITPFAKVSTEMLSWQPEEEGEYTIFAIIDPENKIAESNEENNVITGTITVLPNLPDTTPPDMTDFIIEDEVQTVFDAAVGLDASANDPDKMTASGIDAIQFIEFEYALGLRRWVQIDRSGWVDYQLAQRDYPWRLKPTYGMRYMQAWAVDKARNFSLNPSVDVIDLLPTEEAAFVAQHGVVFYRFQLKQAETFAATLTTLDGDADLYIWGADGRLWSSNNHDTQSENIRFETPYDGIYQIEVHGFTDADYTLQLGATTNEPQRRQTTEDEEAKPKPEAPAVPLDEWPEYYDIEPPPPPYKKYYLPLMIR